MISTLHGVWFRPAVLGGFGGMSDRSFSFTFICSFRLFGGGAVGEGWVVLKGTGLEGLLVMGEHSDVGSYAALYCMLVSARDLSRLSVFFLHLMCQGIILWLPMLHYF
jgi:hypothetical protein